jgi:outer membrane lipoprotein-sorting protein
VVKLGCRFRGSTGSGKEDSERAARFKEVKKMARRIKVVIIPAITLAFAVCFLAANQAFADDFSKFIEKAKEQYEAYRSEVQDETVVHEMKTASPAGEIVSETTIYRKVGATRIDSKMQLPSQSPDADMPQVMTSTVIHDGTDFWMVTPVTGKRKLNAHEAEGYKTEEFLWDMIPEGAQMVGSETVGERDCYIVQLNGEEDAPGAKLWMDKKTHAIVVIQSGKVRGQEHRLVNSDFRSVETDWEIPYKTQIYRGDRLISTLTVKSREVNKGLSEDLFDPEKMSSEKVGVGDLKEMIQKQTGGED